MSRKIANTPVDPTLPHATVTLQGEEYHLIFTFGALAIAEAKLREAGYKVSLLRSLVLPSADPSILAPLFYASLVHFHSPITYDEACALVRLEDIPAVTKAIVEAHRLSMPEDDKQGPPEGPGIAG